jgi:hypothetical protein
LLTCSVWLFSTDVSNCTCVTVMDVTINYQINNARFVDTTVTSRNAVVQSKFPHWFSSALRCCIRKNNYYYRHLKKNKPDVLCDKFSLYCKLVKATIKADRLRWLKPVDANLKLQPKQFWKFNLSLACGWGYSLGWTLWSCRHNH